MLLDTTSDSFNSQFSVVSCAIEAQGKWLFLKRSPLSEQGNRWGFPTGKVESGESLIDAICREVLEETHKIFLPQEIHPFRSYGVQWTPIEFEYHLFHTHIAQPFNVILNQREHTDYQWLSISEGLQLNLVDDASQILWDLHNHLDQQ